MYKVLVTKTNKKTLQQTEELPRNYTWRSDLVNAYPWSNQFVFLDDFLTVELETTTEKVRIEKR